jgi:FkbM family methyltransferase
MGTFTYQLIDQFPSIRVVAIEPQPDLADLIRSNLDELHKGSYEVFDVAIGSNEAKMSLEIPEGNRGAGTLTPEIFEPFEQSTKITVRTVPAEWIFQQSKFGWPTLIKMDVQGYESLVIRSLRPAFQASIPRAVVFEHMSGIDPGWRQIFSELTASRYVIFAIRRNAWATWLEPVNAATDRATDYAAVRGDLVEPIKPQKIPIPSRNRQRGRLPTTAPPRQS